MTTDQRSVRRGLRRGAVLATGALVALAGAVAPGAASAGAATPPRNGIVCTTGGPGAADHHPVFDLTTRTGYIDLPDGNTAYMWGYSSGFDDFQHPGPVLCVTEGDVVTVILHNTLDVPASVVFPGQDDVLADGVPSQPQTGSGGFMTSLAQPATAQTGTVTYSFTAGHAGTFLYESGTDPETQVRMGLFGALVVRPSLGPDYAYDYADTQFEPTEEFMVLLSEIDPYQHAAVEQGKPFDLTRYKARYWLINGRGYPDSIADNGASWLPSQPYGSLATVKPYDPVTHPRSGMARYLSVGSEDYPFHPHGNNGLVVGRDGRPLRAQSSGHEDLSMEKFAVNIGPGQTWDVLFRWKDAEDYSVANPVTVTVPSLANQVVGTFYSGSPYLGNTHDLPPGVQTLNQCGEFYIISHNHALFQITSWGVNMTGPITYMRIEPPEPNTCP
ncbi:multicopper oxidase domain-containing protein [Arthrobacter sp. NEB 688]|uniref:multicopper oxidase domain-containing protein n=1 Tax=Arthrobacter sp. NEB 688 TaxID=904039 RepID=UPI001565C0F7|nr:multicopper oxidase domain-containing protein [Arthrobacter sp. NEB 688]QKE83924.1 multicopper oxidase domain-containing protein [Arthrobacter sp. NEB 688]